MRANYLCGVSALSRSEMEFRRGDANTSGTQPMCQRTQASIISVSLPELLGLLPTHTVFPHDERITIRASFPYISHT